LTRVVVVPFRGGSDMGLQLARTWREDLASALVEQARYTRIVQGTAVERALSVAQSGRVSREEALRLGRKVGAERVVWGAIGDIESKTRMEFDRVRRAKGIRKNRTALFRHLLPRLARDEHRFDQIA
jgi:hypothetical protein